MTPHAVGRCLLRLLSIVTLVLLAWWLAAEARLPGRQAAVDEILRRSQPEASGR